MVIPDTFGTRGERVISSYDWTELTSGIGYKEFLALSNTEGKALVTSAIPSYIFSTTRTSTGTTELNFDYEFLAPATIEGTGYCQFTVSVTGDAGGASESQDNKIRLIHVNKAAAETELVATITKNHSNNTTTKTNRRMSLTMTIPKTHFAIGEKLRLEYIMDTTEDTAGTFVVYHDPANRASPGNDQLGEAARTDFKLIIPFRINL